MLDPPPLPHFLRGYHRNGGGIGGVGPSLFSQVYTNSQKNGSAKGFEKRNNNGPTTKITILNNLKIQNNLYLYSASRGRCRVFQRVLEGPHSPTKAPIRSVTVVGPIFCDYPHCSCHWGHPWDQASPRCQVKLDPVIC